MTDSEIYTNGCKTYLKALQTFRLQKYTQKNYIWACGTNEGWGGGQSFFLPPVKKAQVQRERVGGQIPLGQKPK